MEGVVRVARPGTLEESIGETGTESASVRGSFASRRLHAPGLGYDSTQLGTLCIDRRTPSLACGSRRRPDSYYFGLADASLHHYGMCATAAKTRTNGDAATIDILVTGDI